VAEDNCLLMNKRISLLLVVCVAAALGVWGARHFKNINRNQFGQAVLSSLTNRTPSWDEAVARVKADRGEAAGGALVVPPELKHYSDRHWFLATQVAEIDKYKVHTCQDFLDLAAMLERGEMVTVPWVTETYVLFGIGERADEGVFARYDDGHNIELYNEAQLNEAYKQFADKRSNLESEIKALNAQAAKLTRRERTKRSELQKQLSAREQELASLDEDKASLDQFYKQPDSRRKLFRDYESLQTLAKNFGGRSYNIDNPSDREALKINMLSSLRPEALKVLEAVASAYHRQFDRPLPVSSLVRPEQYQRALRRVNRNAVLIDTPPHSTGLAFDIDYRYMSATEQTFVMADLARLKNEQRIEVIRERNANYHVFAFINGTRPSDDLITASLEKASMPVEEAHHAATKSAKPDKVKIKRKKVSNRRRR
jgi:Family of unknown function (DUF5715)